MTPDLGTNAPATAVRPHIAKAMMPAPSADKVSRNALVILATIAGGSVLYVLADILTPLALAVFVALMIDGFARALQSRLPGVSGRGATPLAILLSVAIFVGAAYFIADNATSFGAQLATYAPKLNGLIASVAGRLGVDVPPTITQLIQRLDPASHLGQVAKGLQSFASTAAFVLVYLGFILASRKGWERKAVALFGARDHRQEAMAAFLRIRNGVEQYLWVQTVTGLMIAVASWIAMVSVGLDNALFWAILIFIASYIPVVGGLVAVALPPIFALVQFETPWQAIILFGVLQVIGMFVGNVIQPRMQGRSLNMDPIVLLLALAFWSAVWGLPGAFLSTPLTTVMMVILAQFPGSRWIAILLSADGDPGTIKTQTGPSPAEKLPAKHNTKKPGPGG
jgi:AI-2 transport protein TqsA